MNEKTGNRIKILMVLGNTGRGGAQTYAMNVLRNIDCTRFCIDFAVTERRDNGYETEMEQLGSHIHIIPKFKGSNYRHYIKAVDAILARGEYDIVHGHVSSSAVLYLKQAKKYGCATVVHSHSAGYRGSFAEQVIKYVFTVGAKWYADYWFGCSALAAKRLFGSNYSKHPNYYDIPNAIITDRYLYNEEIRETVRKELGIRADTVLYGHVGSFSAPKNHRFLIEIFAQLHKQQGDKAAFILLGEGPLKDQIEEAIRSCGLTEKVIFTGNVGNVNEYLMAMDAMIFPSLFEGFPVTLLEAQAAGLYTLASDTITKEANLTDCVVSLPLSQGAAQWAQAAQKIPVRNRAEVNQQIADSVFNMRTSIEKLMELYTQMTKRQG